MNSAIPHQFHIPVMGLGFTIDTPLKVAKFGISSVVSIIEDNLIESMREFHAFNAGLPFSPIHKTDIDYRSKRITAYLNLLNLLIFRQIRTLKSERFEKGTDLTTYFELLPDDSALKADYLNMLQLDGDEKINAQKELREKIIAGSIDVNIMTKLDKPTYSANGDLLPPEYSDAMSALRGFAESNLSSSIIFSAGMNPRLYNYCASFPDFFPDEKGEIKKKIILKVSDFRSAHIQGKFLAKKGLFISEFRIESGLNCGGHAFASDGNLLGPILEEFKEKRQQLFQELFDLCQSTLQASGKFEFINRPTQRMTVQGGIGTQEEQAFLMDYYQVDGTGWGSPFLLVPEVTNVDDETLKLLATAKKEDYFISQASPLGVPFNNFRKSSSEKQRKERIEKGRSGSPCYKKGLAFNTEFTEKPICTASREYHSKKLVEIEQSQLSPQAKKIAITQILDKDCLCEGLGTSALHVNGILSHHKIDAVAICPGPNLAFFSGIFSFQQMVHHIYGRMNLLNSEYRPHMLMNELYLNISFLKEQINSKLGDLSDQQVLYFATVKQNLQKGIQYYKDLLPKMKTSVKDSIENMKQDIEKATRQLDEITC